MTIDISRRHTLRNLVGLALTSAATLLPATARAHGGTADASAASSLSLAFPVAVLSVAPVAILGSGVALTVIAIEATASGTVWLLRRASDGATASLRFSGQAAESTAIAAGAVLSVTVVAAGWLLSAAGEVICLIPNALGESLLYNERLR
jgi:hypothetical protein